MNRLSKELVISVLKIILRCKNDLYKMKILFFWDSKTSIKNYNLLI